MVLLIPLYKIVLAFKSVDQMLKCVPNQMKAIDQINSHLTYSTFKSTHLCTWTALGFTARIFDMASNPRYFTTKKIIIILQ